MKGLAALNKRLNRIPKESRKAIREALDEGADRLIGLSKSLAPRDEGDLIESITKRDGRHELAIEVTAGSNDAFHAKFKEHGTKHDPASPFFFPAYRALKRSITAKTNSAIRKVAKRDAVS